MFMRGSSLLPSCPSNAFGQEPPLEMASTLRKRLGRRAALPDQKTDTAGDENSASSSEVSLKAPTNESAKGSKEEWPSIALDDLSTTPPPKRKLRSSKDFSHDKTPPQSLLEKYKGKAVKQPMATGPRATTKKHATSGITKSKGATAGTVSERSASDTAVSPTDSKHTLDVEPAKEKKTKTSETRRVRGVEFDMVNQSKPNADFTRHGPTQGEEAQSQHRRTRSHVKKEDALERQRVNSLDNDIPSNDLKMLQLDADLEPPPPLSIRKVDRTPSPRAAERERSEKTPARDGLWDSARQLEKQQLSPRSHNTQPAPAHSSPPHPAKSEHTRNPAIVNQAVANLIAFPQPPKPSRAPSPHSDSDTSVRTPPLVKKSILKTTHSPDSGNLSLKIHPPVALPNIPIGYIFCSVLAGNSRPVEPWAWCKRWTCCACGPEVEGVVVEKGGMKGGGRATVVGGTGTVAAADGYEAELNGRGDAKPAVTMAEQKICSRLSCGHVRCAGCWMEREARCKEEGPFGR